MFSTVVQNAKCWVAWISIYSLHHAGFVKHKLSLFLSWAWCAVKWMACDCKVLPAVWVELSESSCELRLLLKKVLWSIKDRTNCRRLIFSADTHDGLEIMSLFLLSCFSYFALIRSTVCRRKFCQRGKIEMRGVCGAAPPRRSEKMSLCLAVWL